MASKIEEEDDWVIADSANANSATVTPAVSTPELNTELALEFPSVLIDPCDLQAVLSVVAPPVADTARAPLRLVAVLDKSGSMRGEKLDLVVKAMKFMLRHLSDRDALGLVAYDTTVSVLAPLTLCNAEGCGRLEVALQRIKAGSQTNLSGGLIQGLELHKQGVPKNTAGHQHPQTLQRARFGNTYRRLTDEEAEARSSEHFGRSPMPYGAQRVHEWTMQLHFENADDAALVCKVVYNLHDTFANPVVEVTETPFNLTRLGWGTFIVYADIHLCDGRVLKLEHDLCFEQPEKFRTALLQLRNTPSLACDVPAVIETAAPASDIAFVRSTFLFTDGLANVGITDATQIGQAARAILGDLGDCQCTVSTFGFGADHNADLLQNLAEIGQGIYSYVEDEDKIGQAFGEALGGLLTTTHQNVRLSLELESGVGPAQIFTVYPVEGPTVKDDGTQVVVIVLGDLFAEERRDVLVSIKLPAADIEGPAKIGHLCARGFSVLRTAYDDTARMVISVDRRKAGRSTTAAECHPQVMRQKNRHIVTKALEDARAKAQRGDLAGARRILETASEALSASSLTIQGDATCIGLLADLNECSVDLRQEDDFRRQGSKKMASMQGAHMKQRACYGQEFSKSYTNKTMRRMNLDCDAFVKGRRVPSAGYPASTSNIGAPSQPAGEPTRQSASQPAGKPVTESMLPAEPLPSAGEPSATTVEPLAATPEPAAV